MEKKEIIEKALSKAYNYVGYIEHIEQLHKQKKATSFQDNIDFYNYSTLGLKRMQRVYKKTKVTPSLEKKVKRINKRQVWLLITESWCGDASQTVPIIAKIAALNHHIELKIVLRDSNESLMNLYLTDGGMSIPILVMLDEQSNEISRWGPRPFEAQQKVLAYKSLPNPKPPYSELSVELQNWYNRDKGATTLSELETIM